jgi:hypothetical protein
LIVGICQRSSSRWTGWLRTEKMLEKWDKYVRINMGEIPLGKPGSQAAYPPSSEGDTMYVTYAELFQFCILIVALVGLCYEIFDIKENSRHYCE